MSPPWSYLLGLRRVGLAVDDRAPDTIRSAREAADALVAFSLAVSVLGYCLLFFLPPDGVYRIRLGWQELTRPRGADEQHPPYREVILRMFQAVLRFIERYQRYALLEEGYVHNDSRWHRLPRAPLTRSVTGWHPGREPGHHG